MKTSVSMWPRELSFFKDRPTLVWAVGALKSESRRIELCVTHIRRGGVQYGLLAFIGALNSMVRSQGNRVAACNATAGLHSAAASQCKGTLCAICCLSC